MTPAEVEDLCAALKGWARRQQFTDPRVKGAVACIATNLRVLREHDSPALRRAIADDIATIERELKPKGG